MPQKLTDREACELENLGDNTVVHVVIDADDPESPNFGSFKCQLGKLRTWLLTGRQMCLTYYATNIGITWTAMPAAEDFWNGNATFKGRPMPINLSKYTEVRLCVYRGHTAAAVGSKVMLKYKTGAFSVTPTDYIDISDPPLELELSPTNTWLDSGWVPFEEPVADDIFITLNGKDGDGVAGPNFGYILLYFR